MSSSTSSDWLTVVKVGGSLFDHPRLRAGLRQYLGGLAGRTLVVAGGGDFAEAVRRLDRCHALGEEAAHWLALRSLTLSHAFLNQLLAGAEGVRLVDVYAFAVQDETAAGRLPHTWEVTTDSLAARIAQRQQAQELVLLKSVGLAEGATWDDAAEAGIVDAYFPRIARVLTCRIRLVNFRHWLDSLGE